MDNLTTDLIHGVAADFKKAYPVTTAWHKVRRGVREIAIGCGACVGGGFIGHFFGCIVLPNVLTIAINTAVPYGFLSDKIARIPGLIQLFNWGIQPIAMSGATGLANKLGYDVLYKLRLKNKTPAIRGFSAALFIFGTTYSTLNNIGAFLGEKELFIASAQNATFDMDFMQWKDATGTSCGTLAKFKDFSFLDLAKHPTIDKAGQAAEVIWEQIGQTGTNVKTTVVVLADPQRLVRDVTFTRPARDLVLK